MNNETYAVEQDELKKCFQEEDFETSFFIKKYCGVISYEYKRINNVLTISIPENDNFYGIKPLYCEYTILNYDKVKSLTIQTTKKWGTLYMQIKYMDSGEDKELILGDEEKYIINKPRVITIVFYSNEKKNILPFSVKISSTLTPTNIALITGIIFVAFLGLIVIILIFIYIRKQRRNNLPIIIQSNNINGNNNYIINNNNLNGINSDRDVLINYVNRLIPVKYKDIKDKVINNNCPVERELFEDNNDIIFFNCHHAIHYNCLKEHISKNKDLKELKCFYCNNIFYKLSDHYNSFLNSQHHI